MKSEKIPIKFVCNYLNDNELLELLTNQYYYNPSYRFKPVTDNSFEYLVVFNFTHKKWLPERTFVLIQEPSWSDRIHLDYLNNWAGKVFFHDKKLLKLSKDKIIERRSLLPYYSNTSFQQIVDNPPNKNKKISFILSGLSGKHNYIFRQNLLEQILKSKLDIDIYGRGLQIKDPRYKGELSDKFDGLKKYEYSIAIENSCEKNYVTEKFTDCILNKTVPIYFGAPNINDLFPTNSFINLNPANPIQQLDHIIQYEKYSDRIEAVDRAFVQITEEENIFKIIDDILTKLNDQNLTPIDQIKSFILKKIYFR
ncbi:MAG: glycosyltransferase family 10 [Bacteroidales bacterium]